MGSKISQRIMCLDLCTLWSEILKSVESLILCFKCSNSFSARSYLNLSVVFRDLIFAYFILLIFFHLEKNCRCFLICVLNVAGDLSKHYLILLFQEGVSINEGVE